MRLRLSQLDFNYTLRPGSDTQKVKDIFASLLALKPEDHGKARCLRSRQAASYTTLSLRADA